MDFITTRYSNRWVAKQYATRYTGQHMHNSVSVAIARYFYRKVVFRLLQLR